MLSRVWLCSEFCSDLFCFVSVAGEKERERERERQGGMERERERGSESATGKRAGVLQLSVPYGFRIVCV